ncbi:MAG: glycogen synthase GlgA [Candidatus Binataceae bacterium]|nr:glycogen synthase GlgA [Candidatus Binataceae bacterium]
MRVAIVAAEIGPYAKAGGLADVIAALPPALIHRGAEACVIAPAYAALTEQIATRVVADGLTLTMGAAVESYRVLAAESAAGVPLYLIDHPGFFGRGGIYGEAGEEYPDNARRFIFFGRAAAHAAADLVHPDVLHAHDWHAAAATIAIRADAGLRERFAHVRSAFTIHNLAYQGVCDAADYPMLGIDASWNTVGCLEFWGRVNLMKGAVVLADAVSTVSPTYAYESAHDPEVGFGLGGVLTAKGDRFIGILNGADYEEWDPAHDRLIPKPYSPRNRANKKHCLDVLRDDLRLPHPAKSKPVPMAGMVTRMTPQKGLDILAEALDAIIALDLQLVMLSSGDPALEKIFQAAERRYPERIRILLGFDNAVAHRIQAGSDLFLMPSRFEPCGLTQMYALKYGTAPVVRATGGLRDTVSEFNSRTRTGNGFVFTDYSAAALIEAVARAVTVFHKPSQWQVVMRNCFKSDFSWDRAAAEYLEWFERIGPAAE